MWSSRSHCSNLASCSSCDIIVASPHFRWPDQTRPQFKSAHRDFESRTSNSFLVDRTQLAIDTATEAISLHKHWNAGWMQQEEKMLLRNDGMWRSRWRRRDDCTAATIESVDRALSSRRHHCLRREGAIARVRVQLCSQLRGLRSWVVFGLGAPLGSVCAVHTFPFLYFYSAFSGDLRTITKRTASCRLSALGIFFLIPSLRFCAFSCLYAYICKSHWKPQQRRIVDWMVLKGRFPLFWI